MRQSTNLQPYVTPSKNSCVGGAQSALINIIEDVPTRPEYSTGKHVRSIRTWGSVLAKIEMNQATQTTKNAMDNGFHTARPPSIRATNPTFGGVLEQIIRTLDPYNSHLS